MFYCVGENTKGLEGLGLPITPCSVAFGHLLRGTRNTVIVFLHLFPEAMINILLLSTILSLVLIYSVGSQLLGKESHNLKDE